ncbi:MAG: LicD family protein [Chitinispirillales bacterium]|jgi:lipopolysaccharide cholinephosphotransferase|nr:LicD family protein [Chitinispirillales bacterium]
MNNSITLTPQQLRCVQLTQLELLCEVRRICEKNNIKYNIIAGTLLGAVRHKGYIPWDDDADIAMLRPEYERFRQVCKTELNLEKYYFQDHTVTFGYRWGYGKLRMAGTEFLRNGQEHMPYEQGIFIDIFPLDNVPDGKISRRLHNFHCFLIRKVLWSEAGKVTDRNRFLRFIYGLLAIIQLKAVLRHYESFMRKHNAVQSQWVRILTFPTPNKAHGYLRRWYENRADYEFESEWFKGIADHDEYLTFKFGNWRELPSIEKRKTHPVSRLKFLESR